MFFRNGQRLPGLMAALMLLLAGCAASNGGGRLGAMTEDGLRRVNIDGLDFLALRPGTSLADYSEIRMAPAEIEFANGWRPMQTGSRLPMSAEDMENLKQDIATQFMRDFGGAIAANPHVRIVDQPGPGVLQLTPRLVDVKISAVNTEFQPGETYTRNLGHFELRLAMHDAGTGELLLRLEDRREGVAGNRAASTTTAMAEMGRIFSAWGTFVGQGLLNISAEATALR